MSNKYWEALDLLEDGSRWIKGTSKTEYGYCLMGALTEATGLVNEGFDETMIEIIKEQYPDRTNRGSVLHPIAQFNDHPLTNWEDAERVMQKAAIKADEVL